MVNHMPEIAKMLGIELNEEFEIPEYPTRIFRITMDGIEGFKNGEWYVGASVNLLIFERVLTGEYSIKRKPWKPQDDEKYWYVAPGGSCIGVLWFGDLDDINLYKIGNCYRTEAEARANRDKWVEFYHSDEVLEV